MNQTLAIIKPDGVENKNIGSIINIIENNGFEIINLSLAQLKESEAKKFYQVHQSRPFFADLIKYMTSNKVVIMQLKKNNAVADFRSLIGNTNPLEAKKNTIRQLFGTNKEKNVIHGSDSDKNAQKEISFFFN